MLNLIDLTVPLMPDNFMPFNQYSQFFPVVSLDFRYNDANRPAYAISPFGALYPVKFVPLASGRLASAVLTTTGQAGARPAEHRTGSACVPAGPPKLLRIPMSRAQTVTPRLGQLPYALRIRFTLPNARRRSRASLRKGTPVPANFGRGVWGPGAERPTRSSGRPRALISWRWSLPGGACVSETTSGIFRSGTA